MMDPNIPLSDYAPTNFPMGVIPKGVVGRVQVNAEKTQEVKADGLVGFMT